MSKTPFQQNGCTSIHFNSALFSFSLRTTCVYTSSLIIIEGSTLQRSAHGKYKNVYQKWLIIEYIFSSTIVNKRRKSIDGDTTLTQEMHVKMAKKIAQLTKVRSVSSILFVNKKKE